MYRLISDPLVHKLLDIFSGKFRNLQEENSKFSWGVSRFRI